MFLLSCSFRYALLPTLLPPRTPSFGPFPWLTLGHTCLQAECCGPSAQCTVCTSHSFAVAFSCCPVAHSQVTCRDSSAHRSYQREAMLRSFWHGRPQHATSLIRHSSWHQQSSSRNKPCVPTDTGREFHDRSAPRRCKVIELEPGMWKLAFGRFELLATGQD